MKVLQIQSANKEIVNVISHYIHRSKITGRRKKNSSSHNAKDIVGRKRRQQIQKNSRVKDRNESAADNLKTNHATCLYIMIMNSNTCRNMSKHGQSCARTKKKIRDLMADINSSGHTTNIVGKEKLSKLNNNCTSREHIQLGIDSRWKKKKHAPLTKTTI